MLNNRTLAPIRRYHKQQDRLKAQAEVVVAAMRRGQALHLCNVWYGQLWWLTRGTRIKPEVAQVVIKSPNVVGVVTHYRSVRTFLRKPGATPNKKEKSP
jgi:hypothetical protein